MFAIEGGLRRTVSNRCILCIVCLYMAVIYIQECHNT